MNSVESITLSYHTAEEFIIVSLNDREKKEKLKALDVLSMTARSPRGSPLQLFSTRGRQNKFIKAKLTLSH